MPQLIIYTNQKICEEAAAREKGRILFGLLRFARRGRFWRVRYLMWHGGTLDEPSYGPTSGANASEVRRANY
jgi:hypothetical protein